MEVRLAAYHPFGGLQGARKNGRVAKMLDLLPHKSWAGIVPAYCFFGKLLLGIEDNAQEDQNLPSLPWGVTRRTPS
jgi:hypothetical protein